MRGAIVVLAVALLGFVTAPASIAAAGPSPAPSGTGATEYPAPSLFSAQVTPTCVEDAPAVSYAVKGLPTEVTTVNVTFQNSSGDTVKLTDVPLTGKFKALLKAGLKVQFAVGTQVVAVDAPVVTVNCGPQVLVETPTPTPTPTGTPSTQVLVDPSSPPTPVSQVLAEGDPAPASNAAVLSATGSNGAPLLVAAIAFVVVGAAVLALVTISRRRRNA
ncbi:hypothetical protein [Cellulomonas sp. URHE0023]|uniref:hypothetical protein n=1 Tax=Cellulomonas sp. URHE0023 TaxID=1380354 RepID=UPI0004865A35|nr:hypothetical protein [Cellulomonas sp. URHE0023]